MTHGKPYIPSALGQRPVDPELAASSLPIPPDVPRAASLFPKVTADSLDRRMGARLARAVRRDSGKRSACASLDERPPSGLRVGRS